VVEVLKQPQYRPVPVDEQVMAIHAVTSGFMDDVPPPDIKRFQTELVQYVQTRHPDIGEHIRNEGTLPDEVAERLAAAVKEFKRTFRPSEEGAGSAAALGEGTKRDELREDIGWDRMSSEGDEEDEAADGSPPRTEEEFEAEAGPVGDTDAPPVP
jgi:hypothetical protein